MPGIANTILDTIGKTPVVRLSLFGDTVVTASPFQLTYELDGGADPRRMTVESRQQRIGFTTQAHPPVSTADAHLLQGFQTVGGKGGTGNG